MRDIHNCHVVFFLQITDQLQDLRLNGNVQRRCWLVTDQNFRMAGNRDSDNNSLSHTTGKFVRILRIAFFCIGNTDFFQHFDSGFFRFTSTQTLIMLNAFFDLFAHRHQRIQRGHRVLHNHGNFFAADGHPLFLFAVLSQIDAIVHDAATGHMTVRFQHTDEGLGKYRFTGTGFTNDS